MQRTAGVFVAALAACLLGAAMPAGTLRAQQAPQPGEAVIPPAQIEADWLRQLAVRSAPVSVVKKGAVTAEQDAAGGCDGIKNGQ